MKNKEIKRLYVSTWENFGQSPWQASKALGRKLKKSIDANGDPEDKEGATITAAIGGAIGFPLTVAFDLVAMPICTILDGFKGAVCLFTTIPFNAVRNASIRSKQNKHEKETAMPAAERERAYTDKQLATEAFTKGLINSMPAFNEYGQTIDTSKTDVTRQFR